MKKIFSILIAIGVVFSLNSCKGFLDDTPTDYVPAEDAFNTIEDAGVAVNGLYTQLKYYTMYGGTFVQMGDMRADNLYPREVSGSGSIVYSWEYESESNSYFSLWSGYYTTIMRANTILQNLTALEVSDENVDKKNDYLGQAYAVRALCYFDLARLYGKPYLLDNGASLGAALITEPVTIPSEARIPRNTVAETYALINSDIAEALKLLDIAENLGHINYWGAKFLQAKVDLYMGKYADAYTAAKEVITESPYELVPNSEYLASWGVEGNKEAVLELLVCSSSGGDIDPDGGFYAIYHSLWFDDENAGGSIIPTKKWRDLFTATPNDIRAQWISYDDPVTGERESGEYWLKKFIGNKTQGYTFRRNNPHVMRIAEAYLIAAEAGLETGKTDASDLLNTVRKRADPTATDIVATLALIQTERQKELIGEGDRFFDVMRRGGTITRDSNIDPHDYADGSITWNDNRVALPISHTERISYPELQQNPGYKD